MADEGGPNDVRWSGPADPIEADFDINKYLPHGAKGYRDFIMGEIKRGIVKGVWVGFVLGVIGTFCAFMIMNYLMGAK